MVQIATNEAIITFNDGYESRHYVMDFLQLLRSQFSIRAFKKIDEKRVSEANLKAFLATKDNRQNRRCAQIVERESLKIKEGSVYSAGDF